MKKTTIKKPKFKKITLNFPVQLYEDVKKAATENGLTFTSQIVSLCKQGMEQSKAVELMPFIVEQFLNEQKPIKKAK